MVSRLLGLFKGRRDDADCHEVRQLSSDYIDGDLRDADVQRVNRHLEWCPPCNAFIETLRATVNLLRNTPKREAPEDFRQRVREAIEDERGR